MAKTPIRMRMMIRPSKWSPMNFLIFFIFILLQINYFSSFWRLYVSFHIKQVLSIIGKQPKNNLFSWVALFSAQQFPF
jgi:ABC-type long-subunit fatty acid transport system fused permease/ATPase subunit